MGSFLDTIRDPRQTVDDFVTEQAVRTGLPLSLITGALRGSDTIPTTRVRTSHAFELRTSRGRVIGAVFGFESSQRRVIDEEYEVEANAVGEPTELVPQTVEGRSIRVERYDLFTDIMEEAFTSGELVSLTDQRVGLKLREAWRAPGAGKRRYQYSKCWFAELGRKISSTDDRIVRVNTTLNYLRRSKIS
jgi:hypothetical protein